LVLQILIAIFEYTKTDNKMNIKELKIKMPHLDEEEIQAVWDDWKQINPTICYDCREVVGEYDMETVIECEGDWDTPTTYMQVCPNCQQEPELVPEPIEDFERRYYS